MSDAFQFPSIKIKDIAIDVSDEELSSLSSNREFIKPGRQQLKVSKLDNKGPAKNDSTFLNVMVTFESPTGATIRDFFMVPTSRLKYDSPNANGALFPVQKLLKLFEGLGEVGTTKDVPKFINQYFAKGKLMGSTVEVVVGYKAPHVVYKAPDLYVLVDKDGAEMKTEAGEYVVSGRDRKEAINNAIVAGYEGKKRADFPDILAYIPGDAHAEEVDTDF